MGQVRWPPQRRSFARRRERPSVTTSARHPVWRAPGKDFRSGCTALVLRRRPNCPLDCHVKLQITLHTSTVQTTLSKSRETHYNHIIILVFFPFHVMVEPRKKVSAPLHSAAASGNQYRNKNLALVIAAKTKNVENRKKKLLSTIIVDNRKSKRNVP